MKKVEILTRIEQAGIIAVVREKTSEHAIEAARAVIKGGIKGVEVTFSVPEANRIISQLKEEHCGKDILIGAGTVLDAITARLAIIAGAEFIVSPCFNRETAEICNLYQIPYIPGCMTVNEMKEALISGVEVVKLFPANSFLPQIIKTIKAPLPQVGIMPTGGINLDNIAEWKRGGALAVGVGGDLFKGVEVEEFAEVSKIATEYIKIWENT